MASNIKRLLIANRSEIACRIARTAHEMGIETVAIYSDPDANAAHVALADQAIALGGDTPAESYLNIDKIIAAAKRAQANAVHPGYGFLAENAAFARAVADADMIFVGPSPEAIELMGDKIAARGVAERQGLPLVPSADLTDTDADVAAAAAKLGYPVLVKAAAGGGGRGMRVVSDSAGLQDAARQASREAQSAFGDGRIFLEKYLAQPHHIEVQVFGFSDGTVIHIGERDCSTQRRHQKIIEEAPSATIDDATRKAMTVAAVKLAASIDYRGAGTVEFIVSGNGFYFLEMNTRLQVEHAVTEMVYGVDLVRLQLETAAGTDSPVSELTPTGHAIECRIYAEDPGNGFLPTGGKVLRVDHPFGPGVRVDSALFDGLDVPVLYDPMLAKVVCWAPDRTQAIERMKSALREFAIVGITTNLAFLLDVLESEGFATGAIATTSIEQDYAEWRAVITKSSDSALAAAAITADFGCGPHTTPSGLAAQPTPWQSLGAWRSGGAIRKDRN
jgi:acetyl/propionyl-CoA carboxylase alpha subunit